MWGWLEGIFEWLGDQLRPLLEWMGNMVRRAKWFLVSLVAAILAPINWLLDWMVSAWNFADQQTTALFTTVQGAGMSSAQSYWSAISTPAALMNCVVPLDYALSLGSLLLGLCLVAGILKGLLYVWTLLPFKAS